MNLTSLAPSLAEIPLLDWSGPSFLSFYLVALLVCSIWSVRRCRQALKPYEFPGGGTESDDPYELAYLSAGAPRVAQMAVARLILVGAATWKANLLGPRLMMVESAAPQGLTDVELQLWNQVRQAGAKGVPVNSLLKTLRTHALPLEAGLASKGWRPTPAERKAAARSAIKPLLFLMGLGVLKVVTGLFRDKPVFLLIVLLVVTFIVAVVLSSKVPLLTDQGRGILDRLRASVPRNPRPAGASGGGSPNHPDTLCMSLALFGPAALAGEPGFASAAAGMDRYLGRESKPADSGGGCSSGCGTSSSSSSDGGSGCGGGGCGGCGGGGD